MELLSKEIISLLSYLLPGFISAWVYYGLTAYPKPSQFERIVQALIFTVIVQVIVIFTQSLFSAANRYIVNIGNWTKNLTLTSSIIFAFLIGLLFSRFANNDKIHYLLRKMGFSVQTSYPSEWFGVFSQNKTYVVLHLKDGRRLYGWPEEWPSQPAIGHFSIAEAEWLDKKKRIPLRGVTNILIPANEVLFVEFMVLEKSDFSNEKENKNGTQSTATVTK